MKLLPALFILIMLVNCKKTDVTDPTDENQELYFPPIGTASWEEQDPQDLGWSADGINALDDFISGSETRAFIILKNGRIVFESYQGLTFSNEPFTKDSFWYWASAAKTLTSFLVGRAEAEGILSLENPSNQYLGNGWTSLTEVQENAITIYHQLSMTTGLDDSQGDCTDPQCLQYSGEVATRWAYHNAPYTRLDGVIEGASGQTFDSFFNTQLKSKIGMDGFWLPSNYNNVYYSTARSMARFGLLVLNEGIWDGEDVLANPAFFEKMTNTSQSINPSYGYLWWLNGKSSLMVPGLQTSFPTKLTPNAPDDMIAAMGKNGQLINIVPSSQLVIIRMGENPDNGLVPFMFQEEMWEYLNDVLD